MSAASPLAGSYIRISAADDDSAAAANQRRLCHEAAERNGEHIPPHFQIQDRQPSTPPSSSLPPARSRRCTLALGSTASAAET